MLNFSTLFNYKYLPNGLLLYDSLRKNLKNFKLYVFTFDDLTYEFLKSENLKNLVVIKLKDFEDRDLLKIKKKERQPSISGLVLDQLFYTFLRKKKLRIVFMLMLTFSFLIIQIKS